MPQIPTPGQPVRGSRRGEPIMALFDLLGRHWAMGIVWQLAQGGCSFRELQQRCEGVSPTTLNKRLAELREAGLLQRGPLGYELSPEGSALQALLEPMGRWAGQWGRRLQERQAHAPAMPAANEAGHEATEAAGTAAPPAPVRRRAARPR